MAIREIQILPDFQVTLEFPDDLPAEVVTAASIVVIVVSIAIIDDGVYIKGALLDRAKDNGLRLGFYRQKGRFIREYTFSVDALLEAARRGSRLLDHTQLDDELTLKVIREIRDVIRKQRRW